MSEPTLRKLTAGLAAALVAALIGVVVLWLDRDDTSSGTDVGASATEAPPTSAPADGASPSGEPSLAPGELPAGDPDELVPAGVDAEVAARDAVTRMTTYDWSTVDDDFAWVDDAGTDKFRTYFEGASRDAKAAITALKASATGTVVDSAPKVVDATHVRVLLFVDQEIRAEKQKGSKLDQPRVTMSMVLVDGRWLVDAVNVNDLLS